MNAIEVIVLNDFALYMAIEALENLGQDSLAEGLKAIQGSARVPIPMILHCPKCHTQHIDAPGETIEVRGGEVCVDKWDNPPHRSHKCQKCNTTWRPADVCTTGVARIETKGKADTWSPE